MSFCRDGGMTGEQAQVSGGGMCRQCPLPKLNHTDWGHPLAPLKTLAQLPRPSFEAAMSHSHPVSAHDLGARAGASPLEIGKGTVTGLRGKVAHCSLLSALTGTGSSLSCSARGKRAFSLRH